MDGLRCKSLTRAPARPPEAPPGWPCTHGLTPSGRSLYRRQRGVVDHVRRAPCVGLVSPEAYAQDVAHAEALLRGETQTLLQTLELDPRTLAVERNLELVPRGQHAATPLAAGDRLEVVTLVGGG